MATGTYKLGPACSSGADYKQADKEYRDCCKKWLQTHQDNPDVKRTIQICKAYTQERRTPLERFRLTAGRTQVTFDDCFNTIFANRMAQGPDGCSKPDRRLCMLRKGASIFRAGGIFQNGSVTKAFMKVGNIGSFLLRQLQGKFKGVIRAYREGWLRSSRFWIEFGKIVTTVSIVVCSLVFTAGTPAVIVTAVGIAWNLATTIHEVYRDREDQNICQLGNVLLRQVLINGISFFFGIPVDAENTLSSLADVPGDVATKIGQAVGSIDALDDLANWASAKWRSFEFTCNGTTFHKKVKVKDFNEITSQEVDLSETGVDIEEVKEGAITEEEEEIELTEEERLLTTKYMRGRGATRNGGNARV